MTTIVLAIVAGWLLAFQCGRWVEATRWRSKALSVTRMQSGGKLYRVTEEP